MTFAPGRLSPLFLSVTFPAILPVVCAFSEPAALMSIAIVKKNQRILVLN
jgi:hypothetical protein